MICESLSRKIFSISPFVKVYLAKFLRLVKSRKFIQENLRLKYTSLWIENIAFFICYCYFCWFHWLYDSLKKEMMIIRYFLIIFSRISNYWILKFIYFWSEKYHAFVVVVHRILRVYKYSNIFNLLIVRTSKSK